MKKEFFNQNKLTLRIKQLLFSCFLIVSLAFQSQQAQAQFVTADGTKILDPDGQEIFFTGINLGNWLLWEGYLMMGDFNYRTHTQFLNSLINAFGDENQALEFEHQWRLNYVTEQTIIDLKSLGYNSVRVPFHYNMFYDDKTGQLRDHGFQYFDRLIQWCQTHEMYILLDMHAAPGYQNPGDHSDNMDSNAQQPRETVRFFDEDLINVNIAADVWRHIAAYYQDETIIWGFDLINEPVLQIGREYELLTYMKIMRDAIREVDNNHIIVAEGNWWSSEMHTLDWTNPEVQEATGITERWDDKLVYQTHHYISDVSAIALLDDRLAICNALDIPMINGEYGETDMNVLRAMTDWHITNDVGYFPWSFKKMSHDKCLWTIQPNDAYNTLKNFINGGETGTPPAGLYEDMIRFAQNNIANGAPDLIWHNDFFDAIRNTNIPVICNAIELPGAVEAENYCTMDGIQTEIATDDGGGQNVGWIDAGDWLEYTVDVTTAGTYYIIARVASEETTGSFYISFDGDDKTGTISVPNTQGWQKWADVVKTGVLLNAGEQTMRIQFTGGGFNLNKISFINGEGVRVTEVSVTPVEATIQAFSSQQLTATLSPSNATNKSVSWSSNNTSVAQVNSSGMVTGIGPGEAIITVTTDDQAETATSTITVTAAPEGEFSGYYNVFSRNSGLGLEVADNSTMSGGNIQQWDISGGGDDNQQWRFVSDGNGSYFIVAKSTQMCLTPENVSNDDGLQVQQKNCDNSISQKWDVTSLGDGYYIIINAGSGKALDLKDGSTENGGNIQVWEHFADNPNQEWSLVQVEGIPNNLPNKAISIHTNFFPNPATEYIRVCVNNGQDLSRIEIYSMAGNLVYKSLVGQNEESKINIGHLYPGIYLIRIIGDSGVFESKFVKR